MAWQRYWCSSGPAVLKDSPDWNQTSEYPDTWAENLHQRLRYRHYFYSQTKHNNLAKVPNSESLSLRPAADFRRTEARHLGAHPDEIIRPLPASLPLTTCIYRGGYIDKLKGWSTLVAEGFN